MTDKSLGAGAATRGTLGPVMLIMLAVTAAALLFVYRNVLYYYFNYSAASFGPYWPHRAGLMLHITAGSIALLAGPFQLWSGLRNRYRPVHRWTGRAYLFAMVLSACGALSLALTPSYGWIYGVALGLLACTWTATGGVAYVAIRQRNVTIHRRWMIRAYVLNFAFVFYRVTEPALNAMGMGSEAERAILNAWTCWTVPLMLTLVVEGLTDARKGRKVHQASESSADL